jgi:hypothetical protein
MASIFSFTAKADGVDDHLAAHVNALQLAADVLSGAPQGTMFNGKLSVSVASNDITVAIKTLAGTDPSTSDPVVFRIGNTLRLLTSALSVTKADGTNWFGSGGTDFATLEIDYFAYIIWDTVAAPDELDIGFARIPFGRIGSDFSATSTNEMFMATSNGTTLTANEEVEVIGRFNAILSGTAAFNWSIPATPIVINRPIYNTRRLTWAPTLAGYSANPTTTAYEYIIDNNMQKIYIREGTNGTSNATNLTVTSPFNASTVTNGAWIGIGAGFDNGAALTTPVKLNLGSGSGTISFFPTMASSATWTNVNGKRIVNAYIESPID